MDKKKGKRKKGHRSGDDYGDDMENWDELKEKLDKEKKLILGDQHLISEVGLYLIVAVFQRIF